MAAQGRTTGTEPGQATAREAVGSPSASEMQQRDSGSFHYAAIAQPAAPAGSPHPGRLRTRHAECRVHIRVRGGTHWTGMLRRQRAGWSDDSWTESGRWRISKARGMMPNPKHLRGVLDMLPVRGWPLSQVAGSDQSSKWYQLVRGKVLSGGNTSNERLIVL
ncbi:hypothetical protein VTI74DRAFT_11016 [Chaetomium olivicolor]